MKARTIWVDWWAVIIGSAIGEAVGALFIFLVLDEPIGKSLGCGFLFAVLGGMLGYHFKFIPEIRTRIEGTFEKRMNQIIEFIALGTRNGYFEKHLGRVKEQDLGALRWVIAKYISYKLNKDFNSLGQIEISNVSATEYSHLLGDLIEECSESIYYTCPFTPTEWFVELKFAPCMNQSSCKDTQHHPDPNCPYRSVMKDHLPIHIKALCSSRAKDRKRVINIPRNKLEALKNDKCLHNFLNYQENKKERNLEKHDKIKIRFVAQEDLASSIETEYKEGDYNVLDEKIVMKWDKSSSTCVLIFDKDKVENHLRIFENIDASPYKKATDIPQ